MLKLNLLKRAPTNRESFTCLYTLPDDTIVNQSFIMNADGQYQVWDEIYEAWVDNDLPVGQNVYYFQEIYGKLSGVELLQALLDGKILERVDESGTVIDTLLLERHAQGQNLKSSAMLSGNFNELLFQKSHEFRVAE